MGSQEPIEVAPPCSSNVSFLDCRTHTWLEAPSMRLAHTNTRLDGKMYLPGSYENPDSFNCIEEVFSKKTQTWKPQPLKKPTLGVSDLQGKIYIWETVTAINLKDITWEVVGLGRSKAWVYVWIENIVYFYSSSGEFMWFDDLFNQNNEANCRKLKGLEEGLPKFDSDGTVRMVNYGGKLMVLWDQNVLASESEEKRMIWCAEISLDIRNKHEIWGKVEWFDSVLTVPKAYEFVCATAATV